MTKNDAVERASIRCEHDLNKEICPMLHDDDEPMKNDNPPSTGLLLALDDLWGDMNPRNDYETCRAKYEGLRAGIEALLALQTSRPPGYVLVPDALTAENDAKYALIGEFYQRVELTNSEGEQYLHPFTIDWTTIKDIYAAAIKHFVALAGES